MKKIIIVGAGPGGLAAGMILSSQGYDVHIYEKDGHIGGRSKRVQNMSYHYDVGPTFLMYLDALRSVFHQANERLEDHVELVKLSPMYDVYFQNKRYVLPDDLINDHAALYQKWLDHEKKKFKALEPALLSPFESKKAMLNPKLIKGLKFLKPNESVFESLSKQFRDEKLVHLMSFQSKYLGMSSKKAPSIFTMLSYLEHGQGLYHVMGGLSQIHEQMASIIKKNNGHIHLNAPIDEIIVENAQAKGIKIGDSYHFADAVLVNADFTYVVKKLIHSKHLKAYHPKVMDQKAYAFSTVMFYWGIKKNVPLSHHNFIFADDYPRYLKMLDMQTIDINNLTYYIHHPSITDPSYAKKGHSMLYVLIPWPNVKEKPFDDQVVHVMKSTNIKKIKEITSLDISSLIEMEVIHTPNTWQNQYHVAHGAIFNLSHQFDQLLYKRVHHRMDDIKNLYVVGGATHPGSGLPTIYISAINATNIMNKDIKKV